MTLFASSSSSTAHHTLVKSPASSPMSHSTSPRLRSPRGSSPRHPVALAFGILRHTKSVLIVTAAVVMWRMRPSSLDPGSSFMDSSAYDLSNLIGVNSSSVTFYVASSADEAKISTGRVPTIDYPSKPSLDTVRKSISKENLKILTRSSTIPHNHSILLATYEPFRHPLLGLPRNDSDSSQLLKVPQPAVDVHLIVDIASGESVGPQSKFFLDGTERSPYTNLVGMTFLNPNIHRVKLAERSRGTRPMVWVVDWGSMLRDCHRLQRALEKHERKKDEYVLLMDFSGSTRQSKCDSYFQDDSRVRLAKRSVIANRHYDHQFRMIHMGEVAFNSARLKSNTSEPVMQASLVARERFVAALLNNSRDRNPMKSSRHDDVCFFWKRGDYSHYGFWRRDVSNFVEHFGKTTSYTTLVDVVSDDEEGMEMGNIQLKFIKALLHCKIVVVAQRDEWEDHYRLYESLASGALVMSDPMLAPPEGLRNKTNIIIYDSLKSLEQLIRFHLENDSRRKSIARRGMELALGRYRSWHRVEQLFFGQPLHQVDRPFDEPPDKMTRPQISLADGDAPVPT